MSSAQIGFAVARRPASDTAAPTSRHSRYTPDEIIDAIKRWVFEHGEIPTMLDWDPGRARRADADWRAERFETGDWPTARMVTRQFPGFNAAIEAAGFVARPAPSRSRPNLTGPNAILEAIVEWTRSYGDVPTMADWDPTRARRLGQEWRIARYHEGDWPSARSVASHFGSLAKAVAAAGLTPRRPGSQRSDRRSERAHNRELVARACANHYTPGPDDLAAGLRAVATARGNSNPVALHASLLHVSGAALAWAEILAIE